MTIKSKNSGGVYVEIRDEGTTWGRGRYVLYVNGYVIISVILCMSMIVIDQVCICLRN